jgi:hypothetical protein
VWGWELTGKSARWSAHSSTELLELATKDRTYSYISLYILEGGQVRTLQPITNPNFQVTTRDWEVTPEVIRQAQWTVVR